MKQMKLSLEESARLASLGEIASDLLVRIVDEELPMEAIPTTNDVLFKKALTNIQAICPLLSDGYIRMYNYVQKQKLGPLSTYVKILKANENYIFDRGNKNE